MEQQRHAWSALRSHHFFTSSIPAILSPDTAQDMSQRRRNTTHDSETDKSRQGQLDSYFPGTCGKAQEKSKMAPVSKTTKQHASAQKQLTQPAMSPQPSPGSVSDSARPPSPGSTVSRAEGSEVADLMEDGDIKRHIWSLPTREDLERFTARVEKAFKEDSTA